MSIKSKSRMLGRMIRRMTGLPLPLAMRLGKFAAQQKCENDIQEKLPEVFSVEHYTCGDQCCSYPVFHVKGPKGNLEVSYSFSEHYILKEYAWHTKLISC